MLNFVDKAAGKPFKAVVEHVRDGSTVRCLLLPDFYYVTIMITGIRVSNFILESNIFYSIALFAENKLSLKK